MLLSHLKRLCIFLVVLISAWPLKASPTVASTPSSLPQALQQNVPSCAQSCLRSSLVERFPVACTAQGDIECLCSRYSNMGESLGEVALGCIYLSCPTADRKTSLDSAYGVCLGQKDAVMPTKTALTYVVTSTPQTASMPSKTSTAIFTRTRTSVMQTQSRSTPSAFVDSVSSIPPATSSASSTAVSAARAAETPPRMTPAQIAGLSVAAVAAFIMAIGLMALSVCLRRRRERRFIMDTDEKGHSQRQRDQSARFSHYVPMEDRPEPPKRFPLQPAPVLRKAGSESPNRHPRGFKLGRPAQRLGVGMSNSSSDSTLPLDQIGLAISAELDGKAVIPKTSSQATTGQQRAEAIPPQINISLRPVSTMTQETVFEEDDVPARRRSSMLLPTPPVPIPPIRALQPSRAPPAYTLSNRQSRRRSELFLNIPVRHERPQPERVFTADLPKSSSPANNQPAVRPRLAPPFQITSASTSYESKATTASSRGTSNDGDIIDYYFNNNRNEGPTPKASPARIVRPKDSAKAMQIKSKKSHSTSVSRTASRTSTNLRDSLSSQTSFETMDPNDPTPEDEDDDKQLSDDSSSKHQLSPVAESPISKLRYPKVPRSSNQLVPRSPKSPPQIRSPRRAPLDPSALLQKRNNSGLPPLLLESRPRLNSPHRDPFTSPPRITSPPRKAGSHMRSNSTESWSTTTTSKVDRKSRVQSGAWGKSPIMYEEEVIRPLNVRRRRDEMSEVNVGRDVDVDAEGMKSPVWVPRLTPSRKGDDLFISVGWGQGDGRGT